VTEATTPNPDKQSSQVRFPCDRSPRGVTGRRRLVLGGQTTPQNSGDEDGPDDDSADEGSRDQDRPERERRDRGIIDVVRAISRADEAGHARHGRRVDDRHRVTWLHRQHVSSLLVA